MEARPAGVPRAKQAGEVQARWGWTEPSVWTERMLAALDKGVQGGVWFSTLAQPLFCRARAVQSENGPSPGSQPSPEVTPPTGEPDAGNLHVRFGGRGERVQPLLPTPIKSRIRQN